MKLDGRDNKTSKKTLSPECVDTRVSIKTFHTHQLLESFQS